MRLKFTNEQRANLEKLRDYLESLPLSYSHFEMETFFERRADDIETGIQEAKYARENGGVKHCGTSACAVGHGPSAGILVPDYLIDDVVEGEFSVDWEAYAELFTGDGVGFEWLFGTNWDVIDNHHWGAAARITYALRGKKVPKKVAEQRLTKKMVDLYHRYDKRYRRLSLSGQVFENDDILDLCEVSVVADPKTLKKLGKYFIRASKKLKDGDHWHFSQYVGTTDVVLLTPKTVDDFRDERERLRSDK